MTREPSYLMRLLPRADQQQCNRPPQTSLLFVVYWAVEQFRVVGVGSRTARSWGLDDLTEESALEKSRVDHALFSGEPGSRGHSIWQAPLPLYPCLFPGGFKTMVGSVLVNASWSDIPASGMGVSGQTSIYLPFSRKCTKP